MKALKISVLFLSLIILNSLQASEMSDLNSVKSAIGSIQSAFALANKEVPAKILKIADHMELIPYIDTEETSGYGFCSLANSPSYCSRTASIGYGICSFKNSPSYCSTTGSIGIWYLFFA